MNIIPALLREQKKKKAFALQTKNKNKTKVEGDSRDSDGHSQVRGLYVHPKLNKQS